MSNWEMGGDSRTAGISYSDIYKCYSDEKKHFADFRLHSTWNHVTDDLLQGDRKISHILDKSKYDKTHTEMKVKAPPHPFESTVLTEKRHSTSWRSPCTSVSVACNAGIRTQHVDNTKVRNCVHGTIEYMCREGQRLSVNLCRRYMSAFGSLVLALVV